MYFDFPKLNRKSRNERFLSAIFFFWRSDFAAGFEDAVKDSQPNSEIVSYYNNTEFVQMGLRLKISLWQKFVGLMLISEVNNFQY